MNERWPVTPATFEQFMDHLLHVIRVVGIDHVGIGIDFDGGGGVEGLQDATQYPRITERLLKEGYSRSDLAKLWGGNLLRILDQAQKADSTPSIPGVVAAGTPIEIVKEGLDGTEGPLRFTDGSLLFTENRAGRILQVAADGTVSVFLAETNGSNSLALTAANELVSVQTKQPAVGVVYPATSARTLAAAFEAGPSFAPTISLSIATGVSISPTRATCRLPVRRCREGRCITSRPPGAAPAHQRHRVPQRHPAQSR